MQSSVIRIAKGAPDFETLAESLEWQGPHPERSGDAALYKPVRSAPGWSVFKKGFFMRADATICVPERYSALQVETSHKGRVRVLLNDEKLIDDVRASTRCQSCVSLDALCCSLRFRCAPRCPPLRGRDRTACGRLGVE